MNRPTLTPSTGALHSANHRPLQRQPTIITPILLAVVVVAASIRLGSASPTGVVTSSTAADDADVTSASFATARLHLAEPPTGDERRSDFDRPGDHGRTPLRDDPSTTARLSETARHYEFTVPTLVDESQKFISYDVTNREVGNSRSWRRRRRRRRRDVTANGHEGGKSSVLHSETPAADDSPEWIFYRLTAFGRTFHFNVTLNRWLVSPSFRVEYWNRRGEDQRPESTNSSSSDDRYHSIDCYYIGYIAKQEVTSRVAISNCHGLYGVFTTEDDEYFVEPLQWNSPDRATSGQMHLVYKRSDIQTSSSAEHPETGCNETTDTNTKEVADGDTLPEPTSSTADISAPSSVNSRDFPRKRTGAVALYPTDNVSPPEWITHRNRSDRTSNIELQRVRRSRRSVSRENFVETLVVVDKDMAEHHGLDHIQGYVLTIMNIVAKLYRDASIGNDINIVVTRLIVLTDNQPGLEITNHADRSLESFCRWQRTKLKKNADNVRGAETRNGFSKSHDNAILFTRYDICTYRDQPCGTLGLAPMGGMCDVDRSCSVIEDIGIASAFTVAHETGHNFGMQHDGIGNDCGTSGHEPAKLMAAQLSKSADPFSWSSCSRDYITAFLDSGKGDCLENNPWTGQSVGFDDVSTKGLLPGEVLPADLQCRQRFGANSTNCKQDLDMCRELWCYNASSHCSSTTVPAIDGTPCHMRSTKLRKPVGWCYRGSCVKHGWRPRAVAGQWGDWSQWSVCSRTCGGGVSYKERLCNRPRPIHTGKYCVGERRRYRSCNIQACSANSTDFRELQCGKFNGEMFRGKYYKWKPFNAASAPGVKDKDINPCVLNCVAIGYQFYAERAAKVVDGTRCHPHSLDVCISGRCHSVGCDGLLGSNATEDNCRVCNGNNTNCRTIRGSLDSSIYPPGTDSYVHVVEVPTGATHVRIIERHTSRNYLALRSSTKTDHYYINGAWTIDWPKQFQVAGTEINYERPADGPERLHARGPTTDSLDVMLLLQEKSVIVDYEYSIPDNTPSSTVRLGPTSLMGVSADVRMTLPETASHVTAIHADNDVYSDNVRSVDRRVPANDVAMATGRQVVVVVGNSSAAAAFAARGSIDYTSDEDATAAVAEAEYVRADSYEWIYTAWSECSASCGRGWSRMRAVCINSWNRTIVSRSKCADEPVFAETTRCNENPCPAEWRVSAWTPCTKPCRGGYRSRNVLCTKRIDLEQDAVVVSDLECSSTPKPKPKAKCSDDKCVVRWATEPWTECWPPCNKNSSRGRYVHCVRAADGSTSVPDERCSALKRPPHRESCLGLPTCPSPIWSTGAWTECSVSCGAGFKIRSVACRTPYGDPSDDCDVTTMPHRSESCEVQCTYLDLKFSATDDCIDINKTDYCQLVLKFDFCKRSYFRQMCCKTCQDSLIF